MEKEFITAINQEIEQLKKRLSNDALADYHKFYRNSGLTTEQAKQLAKDYTAMFLAQELSLKLTNGMTKHMKP